MNGMVSGSTRITVFTKPWREPSLEELADKVQEMGFDGVELAVRPGYQVDPATAMEGLPKAAAIFRERGLAIESVATELSARMVAACAAAGVPILRTMLSIDPDSGYVGSIRGFQEKAMALSPEIEKTDVRIGVQNHCGNYVGTAAGLMAALEPLPENFVAVLDFGHTALCGEPVPYALELALPRLAMANLKSPIRVKGPLNAYGETTWNHRWVSAPEGLTPWADVVTELRKRAVDVPICLTAEYHDESGNPAKGELAARCVASDLLHLKTLHDKP